MHKGFIFNYRFFGTIFMDHAINDESNNQNVLEEILSKIDKDFETKINLLKKTYLLIGGS